MKKVYAAEAALILLLAGLMVFLLYEKDPRPDVTEAEVVTMFEQTAGDASVIPGGTLKIRRIFGLNAADYDMTVYYTPAETMDVCEFFLVRASDAQLAEIRTAMESRIASQLAAFDHYGEHQTELLNKAVIKQYGNYLCLIVAEDPAAWSAALEELLEV